MDFISSNFKFQLKMYIRVNMMLSIDFFSDNRYIMNKIITLNTYYKIRKNIFNSFKLKRTNIILFSLAIMSKM